MATFTYTFEDLTDSNVDWTYSSPTAGSAVVAVGGSNGLWHFDTNETVSVGVGPFNGETVEGTSAGYIFTEMSSQLAGDVWTMQWDNTLDAAANDYTFTFHWCARGTEASPIIEVQTNEASAGWVTRLTTGDINNGGDETIPNTSAVTGDTPWHQKSIDLSALISNASTLIRIRIQCDTDPPASAQFWHNDIGIDSITIEETAAINPASGSPSITKPTSSGSSHIAPRVFLNTTPVLGGATEMVVTASSADGTSVTFDDAVGAPTGALWLGVQNQGTGLTGWIEVTVNAAGATASGTPSLTKPTSAGTIVVTKIASGSPSITKPTSAGVAEIEKQASGSPGLTKPVSAGVAGVFKPASGSPSLTKPTSAGVSEIIKPASGSPSLVKPTSVGTIVVTNIASGSPSLVKPTSAGTSTVVQNLTSSGSPAITKPTSAGVAEIIKPASGTPELTKPTSAGVAEVEKIASGAPSLTKATSAGVAEIIKPASGTPSLTKPTSAGTLVVTNLASGSPSLTKVTSAGVAEIEKIASGSPSLTRPTSAGTLVVTNIASGSPELTKPVSAGSMTAGSEHTASGSPSLDKPTSAGTLVVTNLASGTAALTKPTSAGVAVIVKPTSGAPSLTKPTSAGAAYPFNYCAPDAILAQTNVSGTVDDINERVDTPDGNWLELIE